MDWLQILAAGVLATIGPVTAGYALSAIGLNLQFGYAGLLNFGHVAFMLVGGYGTAMTVELGGPLWLGLLVGIAAAVVLGLLLGIPTLRLRADYFAITSIAAGEVLRLVTRSSAAEPMTGGVFGLQGFAGDFHALNPFPTSELYGVGQFVVTGRALWVILVGWALVLLSTLLVARLIKSPWGRILTAIREDEDATRSLGRNVFAYKLQALMIGGGIAGLAGILFALEQQSIHPDAFQPRITFMLYVMVILGGAGSIWGAVLGAALVNFLFFATDALMARLQANVDWIGAILSPAEAGLIKFFLVGVALMLLMVFRPQGLLRSRDEGRADAT
ncbi:MAG TPA: branched-chain amino acid ABC transporter permease [Acidimicrobiia bacterium]|nr:branched-chain amino acid ABC transporter permease [Acidimicrobiia bacterium]